MRHVIIGSGSTGQVTGEFLEAHGEDVIYHDIDYDVVDSLKSVGKKATEVLPSSWDIAWVCVSQDDLSKAIPPRPSDDSTIVIRSNVSPDVFERLDVGYILHMCIYNIEFNILDNVFYPPRIVIGGVHDSVHSERLLSFMSDIIPNVPIFVVPQRISSMISIISDAWFSTQTSFWNEVYLMLSSDEKYRQCVSSIITTDKRISKHGSTMIGMPYLKKTQCDNIDRIIDLCGSPNLFESVKNTNNKIISKKSNIKQK